MSFEVIMRDCASHEDARQQYATRLATEEAHLARETIAQAKAGDYSRLIDAWDYRANDQLVMRALVLCANKGNVEAVEALNKLAATYADLHAEVEW